ncbi:MAG: DUF4364 family protein [Oscillospiraceae bacterium]|nr:DUF4364 family protein [Oscillospiraceae bacterium]
MSESFGFIHERIEIKVLVLFIMRRLSGPVSPDVLVGLTLCDDGIGYFDVTESIAMLVETKHLKLEDGKYSLTQKGERNGEILEKNLPFSVRKRAEDATTLVRANISRDAMIKTERHTNENGEHKVTLSLSDGVGDIISMELFTLNEEHANSLEKGFRKNAEKIYHAIIAMLVE